jgi:isopentenyldiphosphate isomerase
MELFDRVDEHDRVIGITNRQQAHERGFIHRIAVVYVWAPDGRLWVQHRKKDGVLDHTVGGHVARGETYEKAAKREAKEEIGLTEPIVHLATYMGDERLEKDSTIQHYQGLYECTPKKWKFKPTEEVETLELMTLGAIVNRMNAEPKTFAPGFIVSMSRYLALTGIPLELKVPELHSL